MNGSEAIRHTTIGEVIDNAPYQVDMVSNYKNKLGTLPSILDIKTP